jgi:septal ring-binding cell division protein DamX
MRKRFLVIALIPFIVGCEIGEKRRASDATTNINSHKPQSVAQKIESAVKKIYSKRATPGYYIQVGYFRESKPTDEFIKKVKESGLPYRVVEKYRDGKLGHYVLVGPYISYNKASKDLNSAREHITDSAFIVKVEKP